MSAGRDPDPRVCAACRSRFAIADRVTPTHDGRVQVALRCANCHWSAARVLKPAVLVRLQREEENDRARLAEALRALQAGELEPAIEDLHAQRSEEID